MSRSAESDPSDPSVRASSQSSTAPPHPEPILFAFADKDEVSEALVQFVLEAESQSLLRRGRFILAISGGSLPALLARVLVHHPNVNWSAWEVFYVDERLVPLDHPDSNHWMWSHEIWDKVPLPVRNLHTITLPADFDPSRPEDSIETVSDDYERAILEAFGIEQYDKPPSFDLILLGLGADGHTASLFPQHLILDESDWLIASVTDSPKPPRARITMTFTLINAARRVVFVVTGADKAQAVADAVDKTSDDSPAARVALPYRPIVWFTDEEAARHVLLPRSTFWDD